MSYRVMRLKLSFKEKGREEWNTQIFFFFFCLIQLTFDHPMLTVKLSHSTTIWVVSDFRERIDDFKTWTSTILYLMILSNNVLSKSVYKVQAHWEEERTPRPTWKLRKETKVSKDTLELVS